MSDANDPSKLGRPQLPARDRRSARIVTMVTETEYDALKSVAEQTGRSLSALCHGFLVQAISASLSAPLRKGQQNITKENYK